MVFRNFYINIVLRILVLAAAIFVLAYCILEGLYLRSVYAAGAVIILIIELISYSLRFTSHVNQFLRSVEHRDFSIHFKEEHGNLKGLYQSMNNIIALFKIVSTQKEINHRYLETLVEHVGIGIVSFDRAGNIHLINQPFLELIGKSRVTQVQQLQSADAQLAEEMTLLKPGETKVIHLTKNNQLLNFSLRSSAFKLDDESFTLISLQNITHELNAKEMDAWQKLIRVLTHEIMNSVSPIISLSGSLHQLVRDRESSDAIHQDSWKTLDTGLEAIHVRSQGLHHFTEKYRELTFLPAPEFKEVHLTTFIQHMASLLKPEMDKKGIQYKTTLQADSSMMDSQLMEQVLINLIGNAIDACESNPGEKIITLHAQTHEGRTHISIADNGIGINEDILDKIFIPFFTTKQQGSGIGLALARQIILLHKGDITVRSKPGFGTVFTVIV